MSLFYTCLNKWERFCLSTSSTYLPLQNVPVNSISELMSSFHSVYNRQTQRRSAPRLDCVHLMVLAVLGHTQTFLLVFLSFSCNVP